MKSIVELRKSFLRDGSITLEDMSITDLSKDVIYLGRISDILGHEPDNYKLEGVYIYNGEPIVSVDTGNGMIHYGPADPELKESINSYRIKLAGRSRMVAKWIGEETNQSGTYVKTGCSELSRRRGGPYNAIRLYQFNSRFGDSYNITDKEAVENIDRLIAEGSPNLYEYLYNLVIDKFGVADFITSIGHKILSEREAGYKEGRAQLQFEIKKLIGIRS